MIYFVCVFVGFWLGFFVYALLGVNKDKRN